MLYIVATPIGNLGDLSSRAQHTLGSVDVVAAEDTRHSGQLLKHFGLSTRLIAMHDHNEQDSTQGILSLLDDGKQVAIISDAGTPLISDPGFALVRACQARGIEVIVVPGPSSVTAALSVAGLATDRFTFEGFLPAKAVSREKALQALVSEARTMVMFEAPHRIRELVAAMVKVFGSDRQVALCRELTKTHEQVFNATAADVLLALDDSTVPQRGEFVVVVAGAVGASGVDADLLLNALLAELPPSRAASVAAKVLNESRSVLYERAMALKDSERR